MWFSLSFEFLPALSLDPGFEFSDGFALYGQLDMGVNCVHVFAG
jgi:hypothetical protein